MPKVQKETKVHKVPKEQQVLKVQLVHKVPKEIQVLKALKEQ